MELSRLELAAVKRVNKNSKVVLRKLDTIKKHIDQLTAEYNQYVEEFKAIETYVVSKWGFYSEQILNGEADAAVAALNASQSEEPSEAAEVPAPTIDDAPVAESEIEVVDPTDPFAEA